MGMERRAFLSRSLLAVGAEGPVRLFVLRLPERIDVIDVYRALCSEKNIPTCECDLGIAIHFFNTEDEIAYLVQNLGF